MPIRRVIDRRDPFAASRKADERGRRAAEKDPQRTRFFAKREVQNRDGSFPWGEGFLYDDKIAAPRTGAAIGKPGAIGVAGHRGSKPVQQDAFGGVRFDVGGREVAALVVADGVSASGRLASRASKKATEVFLDVLQRELDGADLTGRARHGEVERAMKQAAFAANFEVIRHVLLDEAGDGRFDAGDKRTLARERGVTLSTAKLSPHEMRAVAGRLDRTVRELEDADRTAFTTFAVAVAVGSDLYTFTCGDAVVSLFRDAEQRGPKLVHLTLRDQEVVEMFRDKRRLTAEDREIYENVITKSFGASGNVSGTLRRYAGLLQPGDRVLVASDGVGPREGGGLARRDVERILAGEPDAQKAARALVREQVGDLPAGAYQDNVGAALLDVE